MNRPYPPRAWPGNQTVGAKALVLIDLVLRHQVAVGVAVVAVTLVASKVLP